MAHTAVLKNACRVSALSFRSSVQFREHLQGIPGVAKPGARDIIVCKVDTVPDLLVLVKK